MWYLLILRESGTNEAAVKFNPGIILYDEADVLLCEYSAAKEEMLTVLLGDHTQRLVWEAWFHLPPPFLSSGCLSLFFFSILSPFHLPPFAHSLCSHAPGLYLPLRQSVWAVRFPPNHIHLLPRVAISVILYFVGFPHFSPCPLLSLSPFPAASVSPPLLAVCVSGCSFFHWTFCSILMHCFLTASLFFSSSPLFVSQALLSSSGAEIPYRCGLEWLWYSGETKQSEGYV